MTSKFGEKTRKIRERGNESLRQMAAKLGISATFLSAMEVNRKTIPLDYAKRIKELYGLTDEEEIELENSIYESNQRVSIELDKMNQTQKDVSLMFARKIVDADDKLLEKLRKALLDENKN